MTLHVLFTEDGIPGWIGSDPRDGSEPVDGLTVEFLARHRRTAKGKWVARGPVADAGPSREAAALQREADHQAAVAVRDVAVRAARGLLGAPSRLLRRRAGSKEEEGGA